jgi:hypothetical protein
MRVVGDKKFGVVLYVMVGESGGLLFFNPYRTAFCAVSEREGAPLGFGGGGGFGPPFI